MIWKSRLFLKLVTAVLLAFIVLLSGGLPYLTPVRTVSASWAGWDSMNTIVIIPPPDEPLDTAAQELKT